MRGLAIASPPAQLPRGFAGSEGPSWNAGLKSLLLPRPRGVPLRPKKDPQKSKKNDKEGPSP